MIEQQLAELGGEHDIGDVGDARDDDQAGPGDSLLQAEGELGRDDRVVGSGDHERRRHDPAELRREIHLGDRLTASGVPLRVGACEHGGERIEHRGTCRPKGRSETIARTAAR